MPSDIEVTTLLFIQLAVVLAACHLMARLFRRIGQPPVVGHMVAGVLLGASGLGLLWPEGAAALFPATAVLPDGTTLPHPSHTVLYALSHLAVALYMFCVGLRFDTGVLRGHLRESTAVSIVGFAVPVLLGGLLGLALVADGRLLGPDVPTWVAVLFIAATTSVAALPVLARMLQDLGLAGSPTGAIAMAGAVLDDVVAWLLLAVAVAGLHGDLVPALVAGAGTVLYAVLVLGVARPVLRRADRGGRLAALGWTTPAPLLCLLMAGAWFTELIAVYAVFGAFLIGLAVPRGRRATEALALVEPLVLAALLPLFFVQAGLGIRLSGLDTPGLVAITVGVTFVVFLAKAGACTLASRLTGRPWRRAAGLGVLMNARGLTGLVLIDIGLKEGVLSNTGYTVLAVAVICTTVAVAPLLRLIQGRTVRTNPAADTEEVEDRLALPN